MIHDLAVNIVGEFGSFTGMRATAEAYAQSFESIGVKVRLVDALACDSGKGWPEGPSGGALREINLVCCDIAAHFSVRSRLGEAFFRNRYNIGVWLWECPDFPEKWYDRFAYYDEIWAPSAFIASTLSPISPIPVIRMPFVLEPQTMGSSAAGRRRLGIDADEFLFVFVFNFYSRYQRKNPMAAIDAFKRTFRPDEPARLAIKCANAGFSAEHFHDLNRQAEGHRIAVHDGAWSQQEMADLMAACDCYVSLHRAEGVGMTIGEAMAAGKPVVATGWSGNMDFMNVSNSFPVRYTLVELDENIAHYRTGDVWAEPSIEHAAGILREVFDHRADAAVRGDIARNDIHSKFSPEAIGGAIYRRLQVIAKRRQFESLQQSLALPVSDGAHFPDEFSALGRYGPQEQIRYERLKGDLREIMRTHVPLGSTVLVVSRGDDDLLNADLARAWHFPTGADYRYSGYHPKDSAEAIEQLETVRAKGGNFLLFPQTAFWWLDHYAGFRNHLYARYTMAHRDASCVMFELRTNETR